MKVIWCWWLLALVTQAGFGATAITSPTGRAVFLLEEPVRLHAKLEGKSARWQLQSDAGVVRTVTTPVVGGQAVLEVEPFALAPGVWKATVAGATWGFQVVSGIRNTPFTICVYSGSIPDDTEKIFGGPPPMPVEERIRLWRDTYGVNVMMTAGRGGGAVVPPLPRYIDRAVRVGAGIVAQHVVAGQHQPGGSSTDWSDPGVLKAARYQVQHVAQRWGRALGGAFQGVHYVDEPGLTWGIGKADGTMQRMFQGQSGWYTGPLAVPLQHQLYREKTGQTAPDFRDPLANYAGFRDFMRFRVSILGDLFAQLTADVHRMNPRLWGFSQVYAWRTTAEGIYPPQTAKGVDILASHGYAMWTWLGHAYPAHEVDAMRSGAWDKPLWFLGPWLGHQAGNGGVRAVMYGMLARKVEGIVWPLDWMQFWPEATEISQRILPVSAALAQAEKPRDAVGLFQSLDQHIRTVAENWRDPFPDRPYEGKLMTAWWAAMAAGFPASRVVEEDFASGAAKAHKVILAPGLTDIRPAVREALLDYIRQGGVVLLDADSTLDLPGAQKLSFGFRNGFDPQTVKPTGGPAGANQRLAYDTLVAPVVEELRATLLKSAAPLVDSDNRHLITGASTAGAGRYVWVVNNETIRGEPQFIPVATKAALTLPVQSGEVVYDVFARQQITNATQHVEFPPGDAKLYAVLPRRIAKIVIEPLQWTAPRLTVRATVLDDAGEVIDGIVPFEIELLGPVTWRGWRATRQGRFEEALPLGMAAPPGSYTIRIRETLTGAVVAEAKLNIPATKSSAPVGRGDPVEVLDGDRLKQMLKPGADVLILIGADPAHRPVAEQLVSALAKHKVKATIEEAARYEGKDKLDNPKIQGQIYPFFGNIYNFAVAIHRDVMVLGDHRNNVLMKHLVGRYDLAPWPLESAGAGRALVWWAAAAYGLEHQILAIYASDPEGLRRGAASVTAVLGDGGR